jgi:uncharacterized protein YerC
MQLSKEKLTDDVKRKIFNNFYQLIADLNNFNQSKRFLNSFLTDTERINLAKRLAIALYLEKGHSYEEIKKDLKVSSATIASVDKIIKKNQESFSVAIEKIKTNRWAEQWAKKISQTVGKIVKKDQ